MQQLKDRVAFISGAGSGIGRASAQRFAREGAAVVIAELDEASGGDCARDINAAGGNALFVPTDVTQEESVAGALDLAVARFGKVDTLVNCAGGSLAEDGPVTDVAMDVWERTIDLDLKGPFLCCRLGIPFLMRPKASLFGSRITRMSQPRLRALISAPITSRSEK